MRNGDADSAVRILPVDGSAPIDVPVPAEPKPRSWQIPLLAVAGVLGIFLVATRPTSTDPPGTSIPPAPIAAMDAETVDLRVAPELAATGEWSSIALEADSSISDVVRTGASFVAVGWNQDHARVWTSGTGSSWRRVGGVEIPENVLSSIEHVETWHNGLVALGYAGDNPASWTSSYVTNWIYHGPIGTFGSERIEQLVAGPFLLATTVTEGQTRGYRSDDGVTWESLGVLFPIEGSEIVGITADDEWFFAFGIEGECEECPGMIQRSRDGITWEPADIEFGEEGGFISNVAVADGGMVAVGWDYEDHTRAAIWTSSDGSEWIRVATDEPLLHASYTTLRLIDLRGGDNPWAELSIDGALIEVTEGSSVATAAGVITVSRITEDSVGFNNRVTLDPGEVTSLEAHFVLREAYVEGPRILIVGDTHWMNEGSLTVWSSLDAGETWSREVFDSADGIGSSTAVMSGANILVFSDDGPIVWRSQWDTAQIAAESEGLVVGYLEALNNHHATSLIDLLPHTDEGIPEPEFAVPSLGAAALPWWDGRGMLDGAAVTDTVEYLDGTRASIRVLDCASSVWLGQADRINVRCEYEVESDLLSAFDSEDTTGFAVGVIRDGSLHGVEIEEAPSVRMWDLLTTHSPVTRRFDESTAADHLAALESFMGSLLGPGQSRIVETAAGTMEWSWIDLPADIDYIGSSTWSELGFFMIGYQNQTVGTAITAWLSPDGMEWTQVPLPDWIQEVDRPIAWKEGILTTVWSDDSRSVVYFDGVEWTEVVATKTQQDVYDQWVKLAVSGDDALVLTSWWDDDYLLMQSAAILIEDDLTAHEIALPIDDQWHEGGVELAGSSNGFILAMTAYTDRFTVWHSDDGRDWSVVAQSTNLDDAQALWNLQHHRSQYFVVGDTAELVCSSGYGQEACYNLVGIWTSPDGIAWDRVTTEAGQPVATYSIASGPLGLFAIGEPTIHSNDPRQVYLSLDGSVWTALNGLSLLNTESEWWWVDTPTVGVDAVIAAGTSYDATGNHETPFLIVGRLLDG